MYLTRVSSFFAATAVVCLATIAPGGAAQRTSEITSNTIYALAGSGDTLWLLTEKGVNFTTGAGADTIQWDGFAGVSGWTVAFGGGQALIGLDDPRADDGIYSALWRFDHQSDNVRTLRPAFDKTASYGSGDEKITPVWWAEDIAWSLDAFWIAYSDGGLLRLDNETDGFSVFYPGIDTISFLPEDLGKNNKPENFPDSSYRARAVAVDDSGYIWLAATDRLWMFNPADTSWESANSESLNEPVFFDVAVRGGGDSATVYCTASEGKGKDREIQLFRYNNATKTFQATNIKDVADIAIAPMGKLYTLISRNEQNEILLHADSSGIFKTLMNGSVFQNRMIADNNVRNLVYYDIAYQTAAHDTFFFIASSKGLFYSSQEHKDEQAKPPASFKRIYRERALAAGLKNVYAYPSIIGPEGDGEATSRATFAYNLAKNDLVTIDIYDWNMDHVVRIIDKQPREAGARRTDGSGRSTLASDSWDGTHRNNGGKSVAPGVYYFKITTEKGQRAFGKVIVAK